MAGDDALADQPDPPRAGGEPFLGEGDAVGGGHAAILGTPAESATVRTLRGSWAMTTTVIFDLDGVLVDSRAVFLSCVNYAFDKLGLPRRDARGAAALHRPAVRATASASC